MARGASSHSIADVSDLIAKGMLAQVSAHHGPALLGATLMALLMPLIASCAFVICVLGPVSAVLGLASNVLIHHLPQSWGDTDQIRNKAIPGMIIAGILLGWVTLHWTVPIGAKFVTRYIALTGGLFSRAETLAVRRDAGFILYLRSFRSDMRAYRSGDFIPGHMTSGGIDTLFQSFLTFFSRLRWRCENVVFSILKPLAPVIAVARPGERMPMAGSIRLFVPGEDWQGVVADLARSASCIVFDVDDTGGLAWEMELVLREGYLGKTVFVCIDAAGNADPGEVEKVLGEAFSCGADSLTAPDAEEGDVFMVVGDETRGPIPIRGLSEFSPRENLMYCTKKLLRPIREGVGPHAASWATWSETLLIRWGFSYGLTGLLLLAGLHADLPLLGWEDVLPGLVGVILTWCGVLCAMMWIGILWREWKTGF